MTAKAIVKSINLKTSPRLEKELSRYSIDEFPEELKKQITETMHRPDFEPDKLATALERARKREESAKLEEKTEETQKLSFVEIIQGLPRLINFLFLFFLSYNLILSFIGLLGCLIFMIFYNISNDATLAAFSTVFSWADAHPTTSLTICIAVYIVGFIYFIYSVFKKWVFDNPELLKETG